LVVLVGLAAWSGLPRLATNGDASTRYYFQPHQEDAYSWLAVRTNATQAILSVYVADPYLPDFVRGPVYGIVSLAYAATLSEPDRALNNALAAAMFDFASAPSLTVFRTYRIHWIVVSTLAPDPIWTLPSEIPLIQAAASLSFNTDANYTLEGAWSSPTGYTKAFFVNTGGP
jgi:hypothetical protein